MNNKKRVKTELQTAFSSRQYMLSHDFEIYYYSNQALSPVPPHKHNFYEFYFFLEGNVSITIEGQEHIIKAGDFLLIPPNTQHFPSALDAHTPYRRFVLWVSQDYCNRLMQVSLDYVYLLQYVATTHNYWFHNDSISFDTIQSMIFQLIDELKSERFAREAQISLQLNGLILHLNRLIYNRNHLSAQYSEKELYLKISDYITNHLSDDLSLNTLELEFFVSKFYISHAFKDNIGISIHSYITKKRLHACKDAILSREPISQVYERYGFHDYSSFFRAFKKEYGLSPKEYRDLYTLN